MDNYFLEKPHLQASFNGLDYKISQNDNLGYIVVVSNIIRDFCDFDVKLFPNGNGGNCFNIYERKNETKKYSMFCRVPEIPQIVYDSMDEISEYLKKENFEIGTFCRGEYRCEQADFFLYRGSS
jgi:protein associated with RNAse G/E